MNVLMYFYFFIILCSSSYSAIPLQQAGAIKNNSACDHDSENGPVDVKITKQLDIRIDGKKWDHDMKELIQSNIREAVSENPKNKPAIDQPTPEVAVRNSRPEEPNVIVDWTSEADSKRIINQLNNLTNKLQNIENLCQKSKCESLSTSNVRNLNGYDSEICKREVGISKPQFCEILEENVDSKNVPKNCKEIQEKGNNKSGIYQIQPKSNLKPFFVLCDMETRGGGWIVFQKRYDGSENFYREWRDYKFGFGNLKREFWLGLENVYQITGADVTELLVEITDRDQIKAYAKYTRFGIGPETDGYILNVLAGFFGEAGDSLTPHLSSKFSTKDLDQDTDSGNCAQTYLGGWWYYRCHESNLNGKYINVPLPAQYKFKGLHWMGYRGHEYCHAGSRMLIRPVAQN